MLYIAATVDLLYLFVLFDFTSSVLEVLKINEQHNIVQKLKAYALSCEKAEKHLSRNMAKPTKWHVRPA